MASSLAVNPGLVIASQKAIMEAQRGIALASLFTTDFSPEMQGTGATISVPVFSGNASVFSEADNDYETTDGTIVPVKVGLDSVVKVTYKLSQADLTEIEKSSTVRNCGIAGGRAIGRKIEDLIAAKLTYGNREDAVTSFTVGTIGTKVLDKIGAKYDPATCVLILTPKYYGALLDEAKDKGILGGGDFTKTAEALGALYGVKAIVMSGAVSDLSAADTHKCAGYVVPDNAIALGARAIEQAVDGMYDAWNVETDEKSNLPVCSFVHGSKGKNAAFINTACQLGVKLTKEFRTVSGNQVANGAPGYMQLVVA